MDASEHTGLFVAFICAASLLVYFLPSIIGRKKRNRAAIFVLNLLLSWTFAGWVVLLVWSMKDDPVR
jgi:hypothetical protein